jgi:hypothetical protein
MFTVLAGVVVMVVVMASPAPGCAEACFEERANVAVTRLSGAERARLERAP